MLFRWFGVLVAVLACTAGSRLPAGECRIEMVEGAVAGVDPTIAKLLATKHAKVLLDNEPLCEIWFTKTWKSTDQKPKPGMVPIEYRLLPGSLVGVVKLARTTFDLRDQEIPPGVYTLRYAVQPEFEAHRDSHETRDFFLLLAPASDPSPEPWTKVEDMIAASADSIQSMHPVFMPLVKPAERERDKAVRRDDRDENGWVLMTTGQDETGKPVPLDVILLRAMTGA